MGIPFALKPLDCEPFYHGFGTSCSNAELVFATWFLPITDLSGHEAELKFYVTKGSGPTLLGNDILAQSRLLGDENLLEIPPNVANMSASTLSLPTYRSGDDHSLRTHLALVAADQVKITSYFASVRSYLARLSKEGLTQDLNSLHNRRFARQFAVRFHVYSHLSPKDMKEVCRRAKVLTPALELELQKVFDKCTACKSTGKPLGIRKVSFTRILASFNDHLQVDFMFIAEMGNLPILHLVDVSTGYSSTALMSSRDMDDASRMIQVKWFDVYGPPSSLSGDPEFNNASIRSLCSTHNVQFKPRPARRHNKIGSVESANSAIRLFVQRLLKDQAHFRRTRNVFKSDFEILSKATFLKNVLYGGKSLSSFEQAKGYTPSIFSLPQSSLSDDVVDAHFEQVARKALQAMLKSKNTRTVKSQALQPKTPVYYYQKEGSRGTWRMGYVKQADEHIVTLYSDLTRTSRPLQIAYEDLRYCPKSSLLDELDRIELGFDGLLDEQHQAKAVISDPSESPHVSISERRGADDEPDGLVSTGQEAALDQLPIESLEDPLEAQEFNLWDAHPHSNSYYSTAEVSPINAPSKDIGETHVTPPQEKLLHSEEQSVLQNMREIVGDAPTTESKLQFAPQWILDRAIQQEKRNYIEKQAFVPVSLQRIPREANLISSHHFFQIKEDGEENKLKLKCRLVPHGNRDAEKDSVRKDSATAQFVCIRMLLSIATLLHFGLATLDISGAYLQAGPLTRDIYMRPPRGWTNFIDEVWKLVKPAYGLVESGRLWQLCVEEWLFSYGFKTVPGLPQLFVLRSESNDISAIIAKVVDDMLIAGSDFEIHRLYSAISKRFKVGRFIRKQSFVFNRLRIQVQKKYGITVSMQEFMDKIQPINLTRERKKQHEDKCTDEELKELQSLAGKLNYLGHGVLPQACLVASKFQQLVGVLRVKHLKELNTALNHLRKLDPTLHYVAPTQALSRKDSSTLLLQAFSDASTGKSSYGQTGYIAGLMLPSKKGSVYHTLDWHSSKQSRISFSSVGAEIIAAAESADRSLLLAECFAEIFKSKAPLLSLTVDSYGLHSTITTLHEGRDYRLRPTVSRLRDSFESNEIGCVQWIPGKDNPADALTKVNPSTFKMLNEIMQSGLLTSKQNANAVMQLSH